MLLSCRFEWSSIFKSCVSIKELKKEREKKKEGKAKGNEKRERRKQKGKGDRDFSRVQITSEIVLREHLQN